jgi:O-methyltransferase involved in polyketide biosynthesis
VTALGQLPGSCGRVQVVNLGAGMDTRPWRLPLPGVHYVCVDQPDIMRLKKKLLAAAGAQLGAAAAGGSDAAVTCTGGGDDGGSDGGGGSGGYRFPLTAATWSGVGVDLSVVPLAEALAAGGFLAGATTVWVAEALIYYLHLPQALRLLGAMAELSGPHSRLLATCMDRCGGEGGREGGGRVGLAGACRPPAGWPAG